MLKKSAFRIKLLTNSLLPNNSVLITKICYIEMTNNQLPSAKYPQYNTCYIHLHRYSLITNSNSVTVRNIKLQNTLLRKVYIKHFNIFLLISPPYHKITFIADRTDQVIIALILPPYPNIC